MRHRIVISALEVVEAGFGVVVVASVAQGVEVGNVGTGGDCCAVCVGYAEYFAPGVIAVIGKQDRGRFYVFWLMPSGISQPSLLWCRSGG